MCSGRSRPIDCIRSGQRSEDVAEPNTSGLNYNYEVRLLSMSGRPSSRWFAWTIRRRQSCASMASMPDSGRRCGPRQVRFQGSTTSSTGFPSSPPSRRPPTNVFADRLSKARGGWLRISSNPLIHNGLMNRCNVGLCDIPFIYPDTGISPAEGLLQQRDDRFAVHGQR